MTDTPRTDRVARGRSEIASPTVVDVEFARTLERELAALRAAQGEAVAWVKWMHEGGRTHRWLAWAEKDQPGAFALYAAPPAKERTDG